MASRRSGSSPPPSGDPYDSETAVASCRLQRTRWTRATSLDLVQKTRHLGAKLLETQDGWGSTPQQKARLVCPALGQLI